MKKYHIVLVICLVVLTTALVTILAMVDIVLDVIQSPAATTNITIERLKITSEDAVIELEGFSGSVNSKIIDLIILAASK